MAKSRGRKFAELVAPTNGVFAAASIPTITLSKLSASTFSVNSESASLGGNVVLDSNDITEHTNAKYFTNARAQATLSVAANSGHGALAYDNSNGQFTFAGITTEAIQDIVGAQLATNGSHTGVSISYDDAGDGAIDLTVNDTTKVPLAGGTMTGNLTLNDNVKAYFGSDTDLQIYHNGTNGFIINSTGELRFSGSDLAIKSDSAKLLLGADDDLQIYHSGAHSYIDETGTGNLYIRNGTKNSIFARTDGEVILYHNNSGKLATASTGVAITGLATMTTGTASSKFAVGTATVHGSYAFYNNSNSYFNGAVTVDDTLSANNISILGTGILRVGTNQTWSVGVNPSSSIRLAYDGVERSITGHYTDGMSIRTNAHILRLATDGKVHFPAFTFPASDGSANQILQTNGSGTLSWVTNSGGSSLWTQSGSDIYYTSGSVGIGTNSPSSVLHIEGNTNAYNTSPLLYFGSTSTANAGVRDWAIGPADSAYGNFHIFRGASTGASPIGSAGTVFTIDNAGQVGLGGLGYFAPAAPLHINSANNVKVLLSGSNDPLIRWQEGSANKAYMQWVAAGYILTKNEETTANFTLGNTFAIYPTADEGFLIERGGSPNVYATIKNTSTTGTHSYLQLTTTNSSSAIDRGYLIKNAAQNTGNSLANNSLYLWNQSERIEFVPSGTINNRLTVETSGNVTIRGSAATIDGNTVWHAGNDGPNSGLYSEYNKTLVGQGGISNAVGTNNLEYSGQISASVTGLFNATNNANGILRVNTHPGNYYHDIGFSSDNNLYHRNFTNNNAFTTSPWYKVWDESNDGPGSGLDADTLDGVQGSVYLKSNVANTIGNNLTSTAASTSGLLGAAYSTSYFGLKTSSQTLSSEYMIISANTHTYISATSGYNVFIRNGANDSTNQLIVAGGATGLSWRGNTVWTAENDGAGSGLNADLLDGVQGSKIQQALARNAGWEPAYSNSDEASVYYDYTERAIVIDGYADSAIGAAFKAVRVEAGEQLRFTVQIKGNSANSSGMYIRLYAHHGELPAGKTHVSNDASTSSAFVQEDDSGDTGWHENGSIGASYVSYVRTYTASQTAFVSLVVLNWSNHGNNKLYVRNPDISILKVNDSHALGGVTSGNYMKSGAGDAVSGWWIGSARNGTSGSPQIYFSNSGGYGMHINTYNTSGSVYALQLHNNSTELFGVYNDGQVRISSQLRIGSGSNDGYFYSDSNGRTAFAGGDFYIQNSVSNYYNYATNQYIGDSSGDNIYFRGNTATGDSWTLTGSGVFRAGSSITVGSNSAQTSAGQLSIYSSGNPYFSWHNGSAARAGYIQHIASGDRFYFGEVGYTESVGSFRAPVFYDTDNTNYYCNPASTSILNGLTTNSTTTFNSTVVQSDNQQFRQEGYFRTNTSGQNTNGAADAYSFGYQEPGAWSHPYPDLVLGFHTGLQLGGHKNYNGTRFFNDHPDNGSPTMIFSVGNGDDHVRATSNIYAYTSDKRLKENFRPIENAVDKVKSLGGYIFDWREDMMSKYEFEPDQKKDDAGVIAQDVIKVMPAAVQRAPFDYDPNKKGHSKSGEEFMTVQYEKMVPLLIEAIKEQQEQIDQLKKLLEEKE